MPTPHRRVLTLYGAIGTITLMLFLGGCTPMKLYTDTVKQSFDPAYHKKWKQGATPEEKAKLCGTSAC